ncbi:MAG: ribonuclease HI [Christensenellales bacterium]|jgi:ribonuclease HI
MTVKKHSNYIKNVTIYTDGACSGNPGPGGWAAILEYRGVEKELSGFCPETTNNRMELLAAIEGLSALKEPCSVKLYSDSAYLIDSFIKRWINTWRRNDWNKADGKPAMNVDLWERLWDLSQKHDITWIKVRGHSDDVKNERCDILAKEAINKIKNVQEQGIERK